MKNESKMKSKMKSKIKNPTKKDQKCERVVHPAPFSPCSVTV